MTNPVLKFTTFQIADVSTAHLTLNDLSLMERADAPGRLAALDSVEPAGFQQGPPGFIFSVDIDCHADQLRALRQFGFSDHFIAIVESLVAQGIPYVRFDRDSDFVIGAAVLNS